MTVVEPCPNCRGRGYLLEMEHLEPKKCPMCEGLGYRTSTDQEPPVFPRKPAEPKTQFQLSLPL